MSLRCGFVDEVSHLLVMSVPPWKGLSVREMDLWTMSSWAFAEGVCLHVLLRSGGCDQGVPKCRSLWPLK
jgi:hypothetical protein